VSSFRVAGGPAVALPCLSLAKEIYVISTEAMDGRIVHRAVEKPVLSEAEGTLYFALALAFSGCLSLPSS
jgi:hypothetical protein